MDKSMLGDLDSLPEEDKLRMSSMIDQLQIRDRFFFFCISFHLYRGFSYRCLLSSLLAETGVLIKKL